MKVVVLAGGTGGAKLAAGFDSILPPGDLTVIANVADDDEFWGLLVSPDVDATIYRLAGVFNEAAGYGLQDETFVALAMLERLGEPAWFRIGDRDMATHVLRSRLLRDGATLTDTALDLGRRFGLKNTVLPISDMPIRTRFLTEAGDLSFQEYFVRERLKPNLVSLRFAGIEHASPTSPVVEALRAADLVVIGPSNPVISVAPMLQLIAPHLRRDVTVAVTPIVRGVALKGPTVEMMKTAGWAPTPVGAAGRYRDIAATFVLDTVDAGLEGAIAALGMDVQVTDTVMTDGGRALASAILNR